VTAQVNEELIPLSKDIGAARSRSVRPHSGPLASGRRIVGLFVGRRENSHKMAEKSLALAEREAPCCQSQTCFAPAEPGRGDSQKVRRLTAVRGT